MIYGISSADAYELAEMQLTGYAETDEICCEDCEVTGVSICW